MEVVLIIIAISAMVGTSAPAVKSPVNKSRITKMGPNKW